MLHSKSSHITLHFYLIPNCAALTDAVWDSSVFFKSPQRFDREIFLRVLKAEILHQLQLPKKELLTEREKEGSVDARPETDSADGVQEEGGSLSDLVQGEDQSSRLQRSRDRYITRKRALQQQIVITGMDMIGKRVSIFDEAKDSWRPHAIKDCTLTWVENGTVAYITHTLQVSYLI